MKIIRSQASGPGIIWNLIHEMYHGDEVAICALKGSRNGNGSVLQTFIPKFPRDFDPDENPISKSPILPEDQTPFPSISRVWWAGSLPNQMPHGSPNYVC